MRAEAQKLLEPLNTLQMDMQEHRKESTGAQNKVRKNAILEDHAAQCANSSEVRGVDAAENEPRQVRWMQPARARVASSRDLFPSLDFQKPCLQCGTDRSRSPVFKNL